MRRGPQRLKLEHEGCRGPLCNVVVPQSELRSWQESVDLRMGWQQKEHGKPDSIMRILECSPAVQLVLRL